jgi:hypothetical protein
LNRRERCILKKFFGRNNQFKGISKTVLKFKTEEAVLFNTLWDDALAGYCPFLPAI